MYPFPLAAEVLKDPLEIDHGDLIVPTGPGLGVEIDETVMERYPWIPGPWSYFEIDLASDDALGYRRPQRTVERPLRPSYWGSLVRSCH